VIEFTQCAHLSSKLCVATILNITEADKKSIPSTSAAANMHLLKIPVLDVLG
jgi:hypothetical protein